SGPTLDVVGPEVPEQCVVPLVAEDQVPVGAAVGDVVAAPAVDHIVATEADDLIVAVASEQEVGAAEAGHEIVARLSEQHAKPARPHCDRQPLHSPPTFRFGPRRARRYSLAPTFGGPITPDRAAGRADGPAGAGQEGDIPTSPAPAQAWAWPLSGRPSG